MHRSGPHKKGPNWDDGTKPLHTCHSYDTDGLIAPLEAHGELRAQISGAESPGSTLQTDPFSAALSPALAVHLGRSSGGGVMTPPGG